MKKIHFAEVSFIRFICVLCIILDHCFIIYTNSSFWARPINYTDIPQYYYLCRVSVSFSLAAFAFVSGYVYSISRTKYSFRSKDGILKLIHNKSLRLLLPCFLWGAIYVLLFIDYNSPVQFVAKIALGAGHLWFLLMLFWVFLLNGCLELINGRIIKCSILLLLFWITRFYNIPFRITEACYYLPFFFLGTQFYKKREVNNNNLVIRRLLYSFSLFVVTFLFYLYIDERKECGMFLCNKYMSHEGVNVIIVQSFKFLSSYLGTLFIYYLSILLSKYCTNRVSAFIEDFASLSMGIYIFQEFLIRFIYYCSPIPCYISPVLLPWFAFGWSVIISYILSFLFNKSSVTSKII